MISDIHLIYATTPFLQVNTLVEGQNSLHSQKCDFAIAAIKYAFPIQRAVKKTNYRRLAMFQPEYYRSRSQKLEPTYHAAAQFCWNNLSMAWRTISSMVLQSECRSPLLQAEYSRKVRSKTASRTNPTASLIMAHRCEIRETELCPQDSVRIEAFSAQRNQVRLQQSQIEFCNRQPEPPELLSEEIQILFFLQICRQQIFL